MKELNPENWIYWFGLLTTGLMLLPVFIVFARKQFGADFIALSIYFVTTFVYNLLLIAFPNFPATAKRYIGVTNNVLDTPMILLFLMHFTSSVSIRKIIRICLFGFVVFELGVLLMYGLSFKSISIFSGPGILLILCFSFYFFTRNVIIAINQKIDVAKTMMISGILFAYAVYFMVYLFYYVMETPNKIDALIIYFLASLVASVLLSSGLLKEKKAIKKAIHQTRIAV